MKAANLNSGAMIVRTTILAIIFSLAAFFQPSGAASEPGIATMSRLFANPPDDCRIMMRWWWFGPAVTKPELEREMRRMKEGGIGGFEVQPVYPVALDDTATSVRNLPYLSKEFLDALRFTSEKARELGLRMDLTLGSGWPYGGPQVPVGDAAGKLRIVRTRIPAGARRLPVPSIGAGESRIAVFLIVQNDETIDLSSGWRVVFGKGVPDTTIERLSSWTENEAARYFSGVATYEKTVSIPESMLGSGVAVRLDLGSGQTSKEIPGRSTGMQAWIEGPVREAAVISINDQPAGHIWCPPYTVDVTKWLQRGENRIRIFVANTAVNHMAGRSFPDYRLLNLRYGTRFEPQDMDKIQPVASGLLGPVRLIAERPAQSQNRPK